MNTNQEIDNGLEYIRRNKVIRIDDVKPVLADPPTSLVPSLKSVFGLDYGEQWMADIAKRYGRGLKDPTQ